MKKYLSPLIQLCLYTLGIGLAIWGGLEYLTRQAPVMQQLYIPSLETNYPPFDTNYHLLTVYEQEHGQVDCIFLGSSLVLNGINPEVVSASYAASQGEDLQCFNFGMGFLSVSTMVQIAPILMEDFHPRLLVLGIALRDFDVTDFENYTRQKIMLDDDWGRFRADHFNLNGFLLQNNFLYRYYQGLNQEVLLNKEAFILGSKPHDGYVPNLFYTRTAERFHDLFPPTYYRYPIDSDNRNALARLNTMDGNFLIVEMPIPSFQKEISYGSSRTYDQGLTYFFSPLAETNRVPIWRTYDLYSLFDRMDWSDPIHLYITGSMKFSQWLGAALGETGIDQLGTRPTVNLDPITHTFNENGLDVAAQAYYETVVSPSFSAPIFDPATVYVSRTDHIFSLGAALSWYLAHDQSDIYQPQFELFRVLDISRREDELELTPEQTAAITRWRETKAAADLEAAGFDYLLVSSYWWKPLIPASQAVIQQEYELVAKWSHSSDNYEFSLYRVR